MQTLASMNLRGVTAAAKRPPPIRWTAQATRTQGEVIDLLSKRRRKAAPAASVLPDDKPDPAARSTGSDDTVVVLADGARADWRDLPPGTYQLADGNRRLVVGEQAVAADMRRMRARRADQSEAVVRELATPRRRLR